MAFDSDTYHNKITFALENPEYADQIMQATGSKRKDSFATYFLINSIIREEVGFGDGSGYRDLTNSMQRAYTYILKHNLKKTG